MTTRAQFQLTNAVQGTGTDNNKITIVLDNSGGNTTTGGKLNFA